MTKNEAKLADIIVNYDQRVLEARNYIKENFGVSSEYDEENGITTCTLQDTKHNTYVGEARCHPDDVDMKNKMTGSEIAYRRAYIKYLKHLLDNQKNVHAVFL